jgi:uncharacterized protein YndB with AHSA1/START domain
MTVTQVDKDPQALTMTMTAEFDQPVEHAWQLFADARRLERWWGPPTWPATFTEHELTPGAVSEYYMTGPDGERAGGWWRIRSVDAPRALEFDDGFGSPGDETMPVMIMRVTLSEREGGGTRLVLETTYPSAEAMEQVLSMGMEEGLTLAMGQMDAILAGEPAGA